MEQPEEHALSKFYEISKDAEPAPIIKRAVELVENRGTALDLGSGALNEAKFLLNEGFQKVIAVDKDAQAMQMAQKIDDDRLDFQRTKIENFYFPENTYDLVNALWVLSFIKKDQIAEILAKVYRSLKTGGIFSGNFLGSNHQWAESTDNSALYTREELRELLHEFEIIGFGEGEIDRKAIGNPDLTDHMHVIRFLARKSG